MIGVLAAENIVFKRGRIVGIDGFSANVMVRVGDTIELAEPDRTSPVLDSTRAAEETERDRNWLSTTAPSWGVHMTLSRVDITIFSACDWWGLGL